MLCHGFIGSAENFETWVPRLSHRRRLLIPDLPGFGSSAPLAEAHTSRHLARELLGALEQLGLARFDLGGLCLGASVALEMLAMAPARVERLILHTPLLDPTTLRRRFRLQAEVATWPGIFAAISWAGRRRRVADLYRRLMVEGSGELDHRAADVNFGNQVRAQPRAAREWLRAGVRVDYRDLLLSWSGPVGVLAAAQDRILDLGQLRRFCRARPLTELVVLDSAGHGWDRDLIRRQVEVVESFLSVPNPD